MQEHAGARGSLLPFLRVLVIKSGSVPRVTRTRRVHSCCSRSGTQQPEGSSREAASQGAQRRRGRGLGSRWRSSRPSQFTELRAAWSAGVGSRDLNRPGRTLRGSHPPRHPVLGPAAASLFHWASVLYWFVNAFVSV